MSNSGYPAPRRDSSVPSSVPPVSSGAPGPSSSPPTQPLAQSPAFLHGPSNSYPIIGSFPSGPQSVPDPAEVKKLEKRVEELERLNHILIALTAVMFLGLVIMAVGFLLKVAQLD